MEEETRSESRFSCLVSGSNGEDPIGSATPFEACLMVEVAQPWVRDVAGSRRFPERLPKVLEAAAGRGRPVKLMGLLPDRAYSRGGHTRLLFWRRPPGAFAAYGKEDLVVPDGEVAPAVEALLGGSEVPSEGLSGFGRYRQETGGIREVAVCTHGSRDVCCGRFGYPVYDSLRRRYAAQGKLRVWRTSHIGGHRFAPTLIDFPEGRYWGRVQPEVAEGLMLRRGPVSDLGPFYRGWGGLGSPFEQVAEREAFAREGWAWTGYLKEGRVLESDGERAEVRIEYASPDGAVSGAYEAAVEAAESVMTLESSGTGELTEAKQYRVARLEKVPARR